MALYRGEDGKSVITTPPSLALPAYDAIINPLPPNPVWIEPAVLTKSGKVLLGGEFGIGKSAVMLSFYRSLLLGEPLFGYPDFKVVGAPKVLILEKELGKTYGFPKRLKKLFSLEEAERIRGRGLFVSGEPGFRLDTTEGLVQLETEIKTHQPNIVLLDPVTKFMEGDDADNSRVARFLAHMDDLISKYRQLELSFIFSHHFRKPNVEGKAAGTYDGLDFYNFRGGSKWVDDPDTRISCMKIPKNVSNLKDPKAWMLYARFHFRHSDEIADQKLIVNEGDLMRVRWDGKVPKTTVTRTKGFAAAPQRPYKIPDSV